MKTELLWEAWLGKSATGQMRARTFTSQTVSRSGRECKLQVARTQTYSKVWAIIGLQTETVNLAPLLTFFGRRRKYRMLEDLSSPQTRV